MASSCVADPTMVDAFTRLRAAPTRAQLTLHPEALVPETIAPDPQSGDGIAGWHRVDRLTDPSFAAAAATAYSTGLGTRHLAVGGACGVQHYAGRFVLAALGAWVQTGALPDLTHAAWQVRLDAQAHTHSIAPPTTGAGQPLGVHDAATAILGEHLGPIIAATRAATRITERLAYGCIAASCAGAFAALYRRSAPKQQAEIASIAAAFMAAPAWRADRPLLTLRQVDVVTGPALVHERHVCCLIRLGPSHGACGTCPDIDPQERHRRITHQAITARRGRDLPCEVSDVP